MSSERILVSKLGKDIKKGIPLKFKSEIKYPQKRIKSSYKIEKSGRNEFPHVYPRIKDDSEKLIIFLRETHETLNWIMTNWSIYRQGKTHLKKSFENMWDVAKSEFNKIMKLLSSIIKRPSLNRTINVKKELSQKGLTEKSLESKLLLVDFGHVDMLLAYDDYESSVKSVKNYSLTSKIAKKLGPQILKIRKLENQTSSSKWLSAAIVIIGSVLDALGISSPLTEFLDLLALSVD